MHDSRQFPLDPNLLARLQSGSPMLWLNPHQGAPLPDIAPTAADLADADARLRRCGGLLAALFPELRPSGGRIASPLQRADRLQRAGHTDAGAWFVKRDDALPVAGSIKARGGFHEVLALAESIADRHGLLDAHADRRVLASGDARALFARYTVMVGSTGNLGLSIGMLASALGFRSVVHMSADAKAWKKARLHTRGVDVVEHAGDYAKAVDAGRRQAAGMPHCHFVDDEGSRMLFLGYATAAAELAGQLARAGRTVDARHPLFVHIPCGVGGAPGGIAYGLKALYGEHVHCFLAEPAASPCVLVQLASGGARSISVYDIGLDNRTEADGLAVAQASHLAGPLLRAQAAGVFTVDDRRLFAGLLDANERLGIDLEPSAAAAFGGPAWIAASQAGRDYLRGRGIAPNEATHVIWATGGSLVPADAHRRFQARARAQRRADAARA
ncbi:D-serine ammonia-lyase [Burkholderia sp. MSMB1498]|uniref:D-serine ammonia-lyase n=1 Tax=Burkholderia sp. MSMB1498 TaxID=1637842 RepID=UPI000755C343|nr:D-serine ammonia-lyase [Burkholderia sp. MSMB1498]KVK73656.1 D-serine dehydratase [Burkholderia sp. MSMB1498]